MENIMIVEDEAITALDIQMNLEKLGYNVKAVTTTGEEAIKLADEVRPDLILMDIMLDGEIDGTVAAHSITSKHDIPIVFLTAYSDERTFNAAKMPNTYSYLTKPYREKDLRNALELASYKHKMTSALANAKKRYYTVMENALVGIIVHDADGFIHEVNKHTVSLLGIAKENLTGKNIKQFIPENEREYFNLKLQKLFNENKSEIATGHLQLTDGTMRDVEFKAVKVNVDKHKLFISLINDVTDKNKLLEQNIFNDKLATIGVLATGIIHEINNPLGSMFVNLDLVEKTILDLKGMGLNGKVNEAAELITQLEVGANRIKSIVSELKAFGRKDDGLSLVNIHDVIEAAIHIVKAQYKHAAQINTNFSAEMPNMLINPGRLEQVIINLLMNAFQAFSDHAAGDKNVINILSRVESNCLYIDISDNGKGIPHSVMDHIFEPFFTTKPVGIGTGLGLSICMQIIKSMGGKISVSSIPDTGTTFSIVLPIHLRAEVLTDPVVEHTLSGKNILIVNKDMSSAQILEQIIGQKNELVVIDSVKEAIQLLIFQNRQFDVLIVDLDMPDINGAEFYNYLQRKNHALKDKIIFLKDKSFDDMFSPFLERMQHVVLSKPYAPNVLIDLLKRMTTNKLQ